MVAKTLKPSLIRLRRLLGRGYFPSELPPPFTTFSFARYSHVFDSKWSADELRKFWTLPETYSVPRFGENRRVLSIVNPINQLHVSSIIARNWFALRSQIKRSKVSEFSPKITIRGPGRSLNGVDFDNVNRQKIRILALYGRYVKTDISRFYPSIYTHSIPWAIYGKGWCKAHMLTPSFKASFGNCLDKAVAAGQAGQTIGIPIGPDTSRIISELVATDVEQIARAAMPDFDERAVRYVDDIIVGLKAPEAPSAVLSKVSAALYEYQLDINADKTKVMGVGHSHSINWSRQIRDFSISNFPGRQVSDIDAYFNLVISLSDANPQESVDLYAIKNATKFVLTDDAFFHQTLWYLYMIRRSPNTLSFISQYLSVASRAKSNLPRREISAFIQQQILVASEAGHAHETSWLLYWARETGLTLNARSLTNVARLRSSAVSLVTFDLLHLGLVRGTIDTSFWKTYATTQGLKSEMWLTAYEVTKKGWWQKPISSSFITTHKFFGDLWSRNVEFYDPRVRARVLKPFPMKSLLTAKLRRASPAGTPYL